MSAAQKRIAWLSLAFILGPTALSNAQREVAAHHLGASVEHYLTFCVCAAIAAVVLGGNRNAD